jgi:hypothetical protein
MPRIIEAYVLACMAKEWEHQAAEQLPDNPAGRLVKRTIEALADDVRRVIAGWSTNTEN